MNPRFEPSFEPILGRYLNLDLLGRPHRLYIEEAGQGIPLLCLHTAGSDGRQYRGLLNDKRITDHYRVIVFDMPWHGKSSPPEGYQNEEYKLTSRGYIQMILEIADALELGKPVVMGCSIGGRIVLYLAHQHAKRFRAIIGLESAAHVAPYYDVDWLHRPDVHGGEVSAGVVSGLVAPTAPDNHRWETLWHYLQSGPGVFKGDLHFYKVDGDIRGKIHEIDGRASNLYLLTGEYDYSCTSEGTLDIAKRTGAQAEIMKGLGHFPMSEDPPKFISYLLPVLEKKSRRSVSSRHIRRSAMSHAEAVHTLQPATGATDQIVQFAGNLRYDALPEEARHYARRHLLDTVGVMIAGAGGTIATQAENVIKAVRPAGKIPVPGRTRRADLLDAAFLGGTAAHGIELDDGYRHGSAHCGCVVVPAVLSVAYDRRASGRALIEAIVAGYETNICLARACAPDLRQRGFHPTSAVGPFGAAMATGKLRGLNAQQFANALGIAASSSAGLFAFVAGGGDIKRLHAGHASREGMQAALLAEQGTEGPPNVIEGRDGFMQAFAFGRIDKARPIKLPPAAEYGIADCYIKPYACCRHIQPAVEATFQLLDDKKIAFEDISKIEVETYKIAAEHAHVPWDDFASAQLSFPYLVGLAARYRGIKFEHFDDKTRNDPTFADFARKLTVSAPTEIDQLYPKLRPARVTVTTPQGKFVRQADEAWGSREVPLDDEGLIAKFLGLVGPVLGEARAKELSERLWTVDKADDVSPLVEALAKD